MNECELKINTREVLIEKAPFLVYHQLRDTTSLVQRCVCREDLEFGCHKACLNYESIMKMKPSNYYKIMETNKNYGTILFKGYCSKVKTK